MLVLKSRDLSVLNSNIMIITQSLTVLIMRGQSVNVIPHVCLIHRHCITNLLIGVCTLLGIILPNSNIIKVYGLHLYTATDRIFLFNSRLARNYGAPELQTVKDCSTPFKFT